jgi:hypothetical protein
VSSHPGGIAGFFKPLGLAEERFGTAHLDEQRREAAQVRKQRARLEAKKN